MLHVIKGVRVIVLAAHPDDGEFGCGATMVRMIESGAELYYVMFSLCEESVPTGFPADVLHGEAIASSEALGVARDNLVFRRFPVRKFPQCRQEILEEMVTMRKEIQPELVILPSSNDLHQDHATIASEGLRAFKTASVLGYEIAWNNLSFSTHVFSVVSESHLQRKVEALKAYKSQTFRSYTKDSFIRALAEVRGTQIGEKYAEAFEVKRWIM